MTSLSLTSLRAALRPVVGFRVGSIAYSIRPTEDGGRTHDLRRAFDEDVADVRDLNTQTLKGWAKAGGAVVDLYVYDANSGDLGTNATLVLCADGEVLDLYDSGGEACLRRDRWWCES